MNALYSYLNVTSTIQFNVVPTIKWKNKMPSADVNFRFSRARTPPTCGVKMAPAPISSYSELKTINEASFSPPETNDPS